MSVQKASRYVKFSMLQKAVYSELLHYFTGLETLQKLSAVFATLGSAVKHLTYYRTQCVEKISSLNQFILMLAKLRPNLEYIPSDHLRNVLRFTAQNIFITWINSLISISVVCL